MKGPKGILAESISNALADYFVVDQKTLETHLLSNAGIKLHDTQLQPQEGIVISPTTTASVKGVVQYVAFEWHWGKSQKEGGSDWVKDAQLSISGLRFTITLTTSSGTRTEEATASKSSKEQNVAQAKKAVTGLMAYVQDQVQRILDTLTLAVDNVLFTIKLPDGSSVKFGGSGLQLRSLGRKLPSTPTEEGGPPQPKMLLQQFQIAQLYSQVTNKDGEDFPVLDDISYYANIQRSVGNRFQSGFERGLLVEGDSDSNGVVIHAGPTQLEILNSLMGMLVTPPSTTGASSNSDSPSDDSTSIAGQQQQTATTSHVVDTSLEPSFMGLKLSGVSVVLPNGAKLSMSDLVFKYQLDGSLVRVEGHAGFKVDEYPFLALGETSAWIADLVESNFRIQDTAITDTGSPDDEVVVFMHARREEIQKVSDGFNQALGIYQKLSAMDSGAASTMAKTSSTKTPKKPEESTISKAWSVDLVGKVGCIVEQEDDSQIVMSMRNVKANTAPMVFKMASIDECQIPGVLHLADPIVDTTLNFDGKSFDAVVQDVVVVMEEQKQEKPIKDAKKAGHKNHQAESSHPSHEESDASGGKVATKSGSTSASASTTLPFGAHLTIKKFLSFEPDGKTVHTTFDALKLHMYPLHGRTKDAADTRIQLTLNEFNHDMLRLKQPIIDVSVDSKSSMDYIYDMNFTSAEISVAAGYSIGDWKALIPKKRRERSESKPLHLPHAHVDKLKVIVLVKGLIGFKDSVIRVPSFTGEEGTTVSDLTRFYNERVITQVPGMVVNTQVAGVSVSDGVVGHFGGGFLANAVGGAGIGGLVSVAAFDGVKNTIKAGKVSRGVEETDKFQLSDLALGLKHSAAMATRLGATKRGKKEGQGGDVVDFAVGATTGMGKYTAENKARLGGAGAGAAGFAYGLALGGPIGAIAGTIIASAATQRTIEKVDDAVKSGSIKKQKEATDEAIEDINPNARTKNVVQQGFLLKRRDFIKWDWHPHCFVLTDQGELRYYELSAQPPKGKTSNRNGVLYMDSSKGPKKVLTLDHHRVEIADDCSSAKEHLFAFAIHTFEKNEPLWVLAAPTDQLRADWVAKLKDQMSQHSTGIQMSTDTNFAANDTED